MITIDLRSDTVTLPTDDMRQAMAKAVVGDDLYGDDPTVKSLEETSAALVAKEAALFVSSGTLGNLLGMMSQAERGDSCLLESKSHIYNSERGGVSAVAGLLPWVIGSERGLPDAVEVELALKNSQPRISLVALENTHNHHGGSVLTSDDISGVTEVAHHYGVRVHLDGARMFNAAAALGVAGSEIVRNVDTVMFCLSKGLSAPVGSMLAGDRKTIDRARQIRRLLGGGMRQSGFLAAAGLVALQTMRERLVDDHATARTLANGLADLGSVDVDPSEVESNIVLVDGRPLGLDSARLKELLKSVSVLVNERPPWRVRMVTHRHITEEDVLEVVSRASGLLTNVRSSEGGEADGGRHNEG